MFKRILTALLAAGVLAAPAAANAASPFPPPRPTIDTYAGNGTRGYSGDGGAATQARLGLPADVSATADHAYLIADRRNHRIRRVDAHGTITTVAGNGTAGFSGDGGPATAAQLSGPHSVAALPDGGFLIADTQNNRVRLVTAQGIIKTVAGTDASGFQGDGQKAVKTYVLRPRTVSPLSEGGFLIATPTENKIRIVSPTGIIGTLAGDGTFGYSGDGGPAKTASLAGPYSAIQGPDKTFLIADSSNHAIREIDSSGLIRTIAGDGRRGFGGDGEAAKSSQLNRPMDLVLDENGDLLIAEYSGCRIRKIAAGTTVVSTVAGNGTCAYGGDGGPATSASIRGPLGLTLAWSGKVLIADTHNNRIRGF